MIAYRLLGSTAILVAASCATPLVTHEHAPASLAVLRPEVGSHLANAGWAYDRYESLETLDAGRRILVADLPGPGIIRGFHTTRHHPAALAARGVVLEIWFDGAARPAVMSPLADFFGDGCNGRSEYFTSQLIECAPWSYNCYFPMPFAKRARVYLRNDTDVDIWNYSFVEWESLPAWDEQWGYFHATYDRHSFALTKDTDHTFLELEGAGHLVGRQYSVVTDEPFFRGFNLVMEGNNSVDVDGVPRHFDYLGTEDSFAFSWGFQNTFAGLREGMVVVEREGPSALSIYRFMDHMPIRFDTSLRWRIDWTAERGFTGLPAWSEAVARGGCRVDYATVHYWYQDGPGEYEHAPLSPPVERRRTMAHLPEDEFVLAQLVRGLPVDPVLENRFTTAADVDRLRLAGMWEETHPVWIDRSVAVGGHPGNPNPGRRGILGVHPAGPQTPALLSRRVALPAEGLPRLRLVVSGDPYEAPGVSDFLLQAGVHDGTTMHWFRQETITAGVVPAAAHWRVLDYDLDEWAGRTVTLVVRTSYGGPASSGMNEEAFFDEFSVIVE